MPHKFKSALLLVFMKVDESLRGENIGKVPGLRMICNRLFQLLLANKDIIEVQGSKIYVNIYDRDGAMRRTFRAYALNRCHEPSTTALFKEVVKEGDVVVDLGANIGYFTLLAAKLVGKSGKVYSFEPEPKNYNYLLKNIELNGYGNITAVQKSVSNGYARVKLYICPYDTGHHTINQTEGITAYNPDFKYNKINFIEVETIALDDFFKGMSHSIDVIKMDVEGAEPLALSGMDKVIKKNKKLKMFVEFFPLLIKKMGFSPREFIRGLLEDYQFLMFIIGHDYSMHNYTLSKKSLIKINNVDELMKFCKDERDHVNLFLKRDKR